MLFIRSPMLVGGVARVLALSSQVGVLLIMSRMMPKAEFGNAMIVFTIYRLIGLAFGTGLGSLLLYRMVRADRISADGTPLYRTLSLIGASIGIACMLAILHFATEISLLFAKPAMGKWLVHMSPLLVFGVLNQLGSSFLDANKKVSNSILKQEVIPNFIRLAALGFLFLSDAPMIGAAYALWIALAIPWLDDLRILILKKPGFFERINAADARYCGWFTLQPIASQQLQGIDMLVVGALFSSGTAADYSIASRIASFFPFFQYILLRSSVATLGNLLTGRDFSGIREKLHLIKMRSNFYLLSLISLIVLCAPVALKVFGDYLSALPILLLLAIPAVIRTQFSGVDVFLKVAGRGDVSSLAAVSSASILVFLPYLSSSYIGVFSIPLAMTIGALLLNPAMLFFAKKSGLLLDERKYLPLVAFVVFILSAAALINRPWASSLLASLPIAAVSFYIHRLILRTKTSDI